MTQHVPEEPAPIRDASGPGPAAEAGDDEVLYHEKLVPSPGVWVGVLAFGLACFLVGAPISVPIGLVIAIALAAALGLVLVVSAPVIEVTEKSLQVGRAHIERDFVGRAEAFRGDAARRAAGPELDGRAFMCFRPWVSPVARIEITDQADPTPYWLTNTRHPEALAVSLGSNPETAPGA